MLKSSYSGSGLPGPGCTKKLCRSDLVRIHNTGKKTQKQQAVFRLVEISKCRVSNLCTESLNPELFCWLLVRLVGAVRVLLLLASPPLSSSSARQRGIRLTIQLLNVESSNAESFIVESLNAESFNVESFNSENHVTANHSTTKIFKSRIF